VRIAGLSSKDKAAIGNVETWTLSPIITIFWILNKEQSCTGTVRRSGSDSVNSCAGADPKQAAKSLRQSLVGVPSEQVS
jgi:hypothetical protein